MQFLALRAACATSLLLLLTLPAAVQAQFLLATNDGAITITGYSGPGGAVTIPSATNGLSVVSIESYAFQSCASLTNITIPNTVTNIGDDAFLDCTNLTSITIPDSVTSIGWETFRDCSSLASVTIPDSVTELGLDAFFGCASLTSLTIPGSVTDIGSFAFGNCTNLTGIYFMGDAPSLASAVFVGDAQATVYYLPGTTGWGNFAQSTSVATVLWNPQVQTGDASFGVRTNQFGFTTTSTNTLVVVVEACTNLANPLWSPLQTNAITAGSIYFSDPKWTNYPARFYRLRSP
jgi:hypothetical protein